MFSLTEWIYQFSIYAFAAAAIYVALCDWQGYRIPNRALMCLLALWPIYLLTAPQAGFWWQNILLAGAILGLGMLAWQRGWIGAGDVKFLSAAALWIPPQAHNVFWLTTGIAGGVLCIALLAGRLLLRQKRTAIAGNTQRLSHLRAPLSGQFAPYGVAIACGCMVLACHLLLIA